MSNTASITLQQLFRFFRSLPHQLAAIGELEDDLKANGYQVAMRRDRPWFKTWSQDGKQADSSWLRHAREIVQEFEGCRLTSYLCPAGVWTIGWGATTMGDTVVREGQQITQAQADQQLATDLERFHAALVRVIPMVAKLKPEQQAALVSWTFNVGVGAMQTSTLRQRLLAGQDPATVVREELPRWDKGSDGVLPGLVRRRAAEVQLFLSPPQLSTSGQQPAVVRPGSPFTTHLTPSITLGEFALQQEVRRFTHQYQVDTAGELAGFLERVRRNFNNLPIVITSGYRPAAINASVGGASGSEHLYDGPGVGAVDFYVDGADINTVQAFCDRYWDYSLGYGAAKGFVHLGIRRGRPRVRWDY